MSGEVFDLGDGTRDVSLTSKGQGGAGGSGRYEPAGIIHHANNIQTILSLGDNLTRYARAVDAVLELHFNDGHGNCNECSMADQEGLTMCAYPCPTVRAIEETLDESNVSP